MRATAIRANRTLARNRLSFQFRSGAKQGKAPENNEAKDRPPTGTAPELLRALKAPIAKSRKAIIELERILNEHNINQAKEEATFRSELAQIDRLEPQRKWYYDRLGLTEKKE